MNLQILMTLVAISSTNTTQTNRPIQTPFSFMRLGRGVSHPAFTMRCGIQHLSWLRLSYSAHQYASGTIRSFTNLRNTAESWRGIRTILTGPEQNRWHIFRVGLAWTIRLLRTAAFTTCLLYTSDAADERSSVDLGGRRIIKKK